jgi:antitoxin MazE
METTIKKWGNSLALRIPKALAEEAGLYYELSVELSLLDGKLVIAPIEPPQLELEAMLDQITEDNLHREIDVGPAVGEEAW